MFKVMNDLIGSGTHIVQSFMLLLAVVFIAVTAIRSKGQVVPILGSIVVAAVVAFAAFNNVWLGNSIQKTVNKDNNIDKASTITVPPQ